MVPPGFLRASGHNIFVKQSTQYIPGLCAFLFKAPYLTGIADSLTRTSQPAALHSMPRWSSPHTHVFSIRHVAALFHLEQQTALQDYTWSHFMAKSQTERWKMALNRPRTGHLFTVWELEQEGRASPCTASAGRCTWGTQPFFCCSVPVGEWLQGVMGIDFGVPNKF